MRDDPDFRTKAEPIEPHPIEGAEQESDAIIVDGSDAELLRDVLEGDDEE